MCVVVAGQRAGLLVCWRVDGLVGWVVVAWCIGVWRVGVLPGAVFVSVWWWVGVVGVVGALVCRGGVCVGMPACVG